MKKADTFLKERFLTRSGETVLNGFPNNHIIHHTLLPKESKGFFGVMDSVPRTYPAVKGNVREFLEKYHPQNKEIYFVVRIMNNIGLDQKLIAATLNLQKWKTFYGDCDWKVEDVREVMDG